MKRELAKIMKNRSRSITNAKGVLILKNILFLEK